MPALEDSENAMAANLKALRERLTPVSEEDAQAIMIAREANRTGPRTSRDQKSDTSLNDKWVQHIIRRVVVTAISCDPKATETFSENP
jgi:hypothetical protein